MERLWSPWRSQYITSVNDIPNAPCVFCEALSTPSEDAKRHVVMRGTTAFIIMNLYPYNNGHLLVIPNSHVANLEDLSAAERQELIELTTTGIALIKQSLSPHGCNLGANLGRAAGAGIEDHLHFHIVPRWNGDTNFMPVLADTKMISEEMNVTYDRLIAARDRLFG